MNTYAKRFQTAFFESTVLYGAELNPPLALEGKRPIYGKFVVDAILSDFEDGVATSAVALAGRCFAVAREASYVLFGMDIDNSITIGTVSVNGRPHFTTTANSIWQEMKEGFKPGIPANAHAWLTLDSGQILDPTILPSWAYHNEGRILELADAIYLSGISEQPNLVYTPYLTGFAYHLGVCFLSV